MLNVNRGRDALDQTCFFALIFIVIALCKFYISFLVILTISQLALPNRAIFTFISFWITI